jgi:conjugal transfer pilus assembly protein TraW
MLVFTGVSSAEVVGRFGTVYAIEEPDALLEIKRRAAQINWGKLFNQKKWGKRLMDYQPADLPILPAAKNDRSFLVDLTYTWNGPDIIDAKGKLIYPTGYSFNPLDYIDFPGKLVVINGSDPAQVEWFRKSEYIDDPSVTLLVTGGSYYDLGKQLGRPVFYVFRKIADSLHLKAVPSIIYRKGRYMEVKEVKV